MALSGKSRAIEPSQWKPETSYDQIMSYAGVDYYVDAENAWSFSSPDDRTIRFELRNGDQFSDNTWTDRPGVERTEIGTAKRIPVSNEISVTYSFMVEPGPRNTARWLVIGQLHAGNGASPPLEIKLHGNDRMVVMGYYGASARSLVPITLYEDTQDITRGYWYDMKIEAKFDPSGGGYAKVWRDGVKIVDYKGKIGYEDQKATTWRQGIYRKSAPETLAIRYRNSDFRYGVGIQWDTSVRPVGQVSGQP